MDQCASNDFDLLVTDLGLPHQDGNSLARFIRIHRPDTPVIAITGNPADLQPPLHDTYFIKPFMPLKLLVAVQRLLRDC